MTMRCGDCGRYGIHWVGPITNLTGTLCPHCGGRNCRVAGEDEPDPAEDEPQGGDESGPGFASPAR